MKMGCSTIGRSCGRSTVPESEPVCVIINNKPTPQSNSGLRGKLILNK